jgi:hypothetical protein
MNMWGKFVIVWYWGFWGSIIKRHYTFAKFLCNIGGLGVHENKER